MKGNCCTISAYTFLRMKDFFLSLVFSFLGFVLFAQTPERYYDAVAGLKGKTLKVALYNIIKGQTTYLYQQFGYRCMGYFEGNRP